MWRLFDPDIITDDDRQSMADFILNTEQFSNGPVVKEFEKAWSEWQGCKYSVFVNSGSSANLLLVAAMKELYGTGPAVAQGVTWSTNVAPIMQLGFALHLCDISLKNFGPDLVSLERILSDTKCKFLFLTHLLGFNGLSDDLLELLDKYNVKLIEDCCEATGTSFKGTKVGNFGEASSFSFYFAHHFTTVEGGMVCTNDEELWKMFLLLRSHGLSRELPEPVVVDDVDPKFTFLVPGFNVRNTELYAHLGLRQLKKLDDIIAHRNANISVLLENLDPKLYHTDFHCNGVSSFALPIICHEEAQRIRAGKIMDDLGIENRPFISGSMFKQPMIQSVNCRRFDKNSEFIHRHAIYAGNHAQVSVEGVKMLCEKLNKKLNNKQKRKQAKQDAIVRRKERETESKRLLTIAAKKRYTDTAFVIYENTRRIFIDCGYQHGLATEFFQETHPESEKFEYFAFEGNLTLECPRSVIRKAVWTEDCELDFYLGGIKKGEDMSGGSTLIKNKETGNLDKENPIKVECINFSEWLRSSFSKDDYIIVKINIEGAEYPVMRHMHEDETLSLINAFYVSWHWLKIGMTEENHLRHKELVPHFSWALSYDANGHIDENGFREYFVDSLEKWK